MLIFLHIPILITTLCYPFLQAAPGPPHLCAVSYVPRGATQSSCTNRTTPQSNSMMGNWLGQSSPTNLCAPLMMATSVSTGTSKVTMQTATTPRMSASTSAPFVGKPTWHFPGPVTVGPPMLEDFLLAAQPACLQYSTFTDSIVLHPPFDLSTHLHQDIFDRIHHPYNTDAFESFLLKFSLTDRYPQLIQNLHHGFPLGTMPPLLDTIISPNHPSCLEHSQAIDDYLASEVASQRMSSPFSHEHIEHILHGPFHSSLLIVSVQPQHLGALDKICICQHLSKASWYHTSVNSHIKKEDFPTHFNTAARVTDLVSSLFT